MIRPIDLSTDYEMILSWWKGHNFAELPAQMLPRTGFIADNAACGFLYSTDSGIAWMEWITTNPEASKSRKKEALGAVVNALVNEAGRLGFKVIFTSVENEKLISGYKKHGFIETDKHMTNMIRRLG
jgi:hypothetical protein